MDQLERMGVSNFADLSMLSQSAYGLLLKALPQKTVHNFEATMCSDSHWGPGHLNTVDKWRTASQDLLLCIVHREFRSMLDSASSKREFVLTMDREFPRWRKVTDLSLIHI